MSPISAQTILTILYYGSAGATATEIATGLDLNDLSDDDIANGFYDLLTPIQKNPSLHMANALYVDSQYTVQPSYKSFVRQSFYSTVKSVNFADGQNAAGQINKWVANETDNEIKNVIDPSTLDGSTSLVLVNAIYFKGTWQIKFNPKSTATEPFYVNGYCASDSSSSKPVQMMNVKVFKV